MEKEKTLTREQTKDKALRYLEFRSHSKNELRMKLKRCGALDEDIICIALVPWEDVLLG